jgi:membrane protein
MTATSEARDQIDEPRPADGTTPADAIETSSVSAAGRDVFTILKGIVKNIGQDKLTLHASAVAYNFIFAIVPLLIFTLSLASAVSRAINPNTAVTVQNVVNWLIERLPATTAEALSVPIKGALEQSSGGIITVGALLALVGARGAMGSLVTALNASYRVEETRSFIRRQVLAVGLTFATGLGIILAIALFLLGDQLIQILSGPLNLGGTATTVWSLLRFPLILIILIVAMATLYWAGPNTEIPFRWLSPGAALAVVGFVVVTLFINVYFQYAGGYAKSYGVLGGVLAFIFYLYVMSLVILVGGELNAALARRVPQKVEAPAEAAEAPARDRTDESVRTAIRDARVTLSAGPASTARTGQPTAEGAPGGRGNAVRGLAVGAGAAVAGVLTSLIRRR